MKKTVFLTALVVSSAFAQEAFVCKPGFLPDECAAFEKHFKAEADKKALANATAAKAHAEFEAEQAAKLEERKRKEAEWASDRAKRQAEVDARQAEYKRQSDADELKYAEDERRAAAVEAKRKAACGEDYKTPSVGMTMARVRECVSTSFKLAGQTNTEQGVVTTYRAPGGYLHVINGKVVQWGKF